MKLNSITLQNFRSFKNEWILRLKNLNFLIGSNGSGKSNVIEAIKLLNGLAIGSPYRPIKDLSFDRSLEKRVVVEVELELTIKERRLIVSFLNKIPSFADMNYEKEKTFQILKYRVELDQTARFAEQLSVWNQDGEYVDIILHKVDENGNPMSKFLELENYFGRKKDRRLDSNHNWDTTTFARSYGILT